MASSIINKILGKPDRWFTEKHPTIHPISTDRIAAGSIDHAVCSICFNILLDPVACTTCENPFCKRCIQEWLIKNPSCPYACVRFQERRCPPVIVTMLSKLKIKCYYQQNGCPDILNYEALKQHEINCDYEIKKCRGCNTNFIKRDIIEHENICGFIKIRCQQCGVTYERHTEHGKLDCLLNRQIQLEEKVEQLQQENKLLREKNEFILQKLKDRFGIQPPK